MSLPSSSRPLLLSILVDSTGSMSPILSKCKNEVHNLLNKCKNKASQVFIQFVCYRDIHDISTPLKMILNHPITDSINKIEQFISTISANGGGGDGPENISAGFETALAQIESFEANNHQQFRNVFILIGDAPNQDPMFKESHFPDKNERGICWKDVWQSIDQRMRNLEIDQLITISCHPYFDNQYAAWNQYHCDYMNQIMNKNSINDNNTFEQIFVDHIAARVSTMY